MTYKKICIFMSVLALSSILTGCGESEEEKREREIAENYCSSRCNLLSERYLRSFLEDSNFPNMRGTTPIAEKDNNGRWRLKKDAVVKMSDFNFDLKGGNDDCTFEVEPSVAGKYLKDIPEGTIVFRCTKHHADSNVLKAPFVWNR